MAAAGRDAFYKGDIARKLVAFSEKNGGHFSLKDFAEHHSDWIDPVSTNYRGYDVWELPPNGQGIAALEMLNILEGFDVRAMGRNSPEYLHALIEAKKLAFADRARFYADTDFAKVPVAELISKPYAARQRKRIDLQKAAFDVPAGDPLLAHGDTIYLTVVDKERNCCSFIQSLYFGFGSQVVPGDLGFALQNRGTLFSIDATHPNRLEPHKRPFHTIIPGFVTKDGQPWLSFGVMGGDMQPQGHVQVLVNMIDFGMSVQAAGDAARVQHFGSQTPTGAPYGRTGRSCGRRIRSPAENNPGTRSQRARCRPPPRLIRRLSRNPLRPQTRHSPRWNRPAERRRGSGVLIRLRFQTQASGGRESSSFASIRVIRGQNHPVPCMIVCASPSEKHWPTNHTN